MRALRENAVPPWLLQRAEPKRQIRRRKPGQRRQVIDALCIAAALVEGEEITVAVLVDVFDLPYSSAKRMMHYLIEAFGERLEESRTPRTGRGIASVRTLRWKREA